MGKRTLVLGLAGMLSACLGSSGAMQSANDPVSNWFTFGTRERILFVHGNPKDGRYMFHAQLTNDDGEPEIKEHSGVLDSDTLAQLEALMQPELVRHYVEQNKTDDRCLREGGYVLTGTGGGCWLQTEIDRVADAETRQLLAVLVPLYKAKEAECLASPSSGLEVKTTPPPLTSGEITPHQ